MSSFVINKLKVNEEIVMKLNSNYDKLPPEKLEANTE
jgi:hypothetical protein